MISFIRRRPCLLTFDLSFHIINHHWGKRYIIICDIRWQHTLCACLWTWGGGCKMCCNRHQLNVYLMGALVHSFRSRYRKALLACHLFSLNKKDLIERLFIWQCSIINICWSLPVFCVHDMWINYINWTVQDNTIESTLTHILYTCTCSLLKGTKIL